MLYNTVNFERHISVQIKLFPNYYIACFGLCHFLTPGTKTKRETFFETLCSIALYFTNELSSNKSDYYCFLISKFNQTFSLLSMNNESFVIVSFLIKLYKTLKLDRLFLRCL